MSKILSALMVVLSLALFGAPVVSALDSSPGSVVQDGDEGKKKGGKKKHKKGKGKKKHHGKKKGAGKHGKKKNKK